jgi:hypothetical protein
MTRPTDHEKAALAALARQCANDPELKKAIDHLKRTGSPLYSALLEELAGLSHDLEGMMMAVLCHGAPKA